MNNRIHLEPQTFGPRDLLEARRQFRADTAEIYATAPNEAADEVVFVDDVINPDIDAFFRSFAEEHSPHDTDDQAVVSGLAITPEGTLDVEIDLTDDPTWKELEEIKASGFVNPFAGILPHTQPVDDELIDRIFAGIQPASHTPAGPENYDHLFEDEAPDTAATTAIKELEDDIAREAELMLMIEGIAAKEEVTPLPTSAVSVTAKRAEKKSRFRRFGTAIAAGVIAVGAMVGGMLAGGEAQEPLPVSPDIETVDSSANDLAAASAAVPTAEMPTTIENIDQANLRLVFDGLSSCIQSYGDAGCLQAMEYAAFVSQ